MAAARRGLLKASTEIISAENADHGDGQQSLTPNSRVQLHGARRS